MDADTGRAPPKRVETISASVMLNAPYPGAVSLVEDPPRGWTYRQNATDLPLYTSDKDPPGKSTCYKGCDTLWMPVIAAPEARPVGDWTIVERRDGMRQWAYNGKPVYTNIHDSPDAPSADGKDGVWHLLPYGK